MQSVREQEEERAFCRHLKRKPKVFFEASNRRGKNSGKAARSARPNGSEVAKAPPQWPFFKMPFSAVFFTPPLSLALSVCLPFLLGCRRRVARPGSRISQFASRRTRHRSARSAGRAGKRERERESGRQRRRKFGSGPTPAPPPPAWFLHASFFAKVPARTARAAAGHP